MTLAQRKRPRWLLAILIAVGAGAFAAGWWIPRGEPRTSTAPPVLRSQTAGRVAPAVSQSEGAVPRALDSIQLEAIRTAVREEVDATLAERDAARVAEPAPPPAEPTPDSPSGQAAAAAAASARARVEAARRSRRWTREDAAALRSAIGKMTANERDDILSTLVPAVNRGEIQPDYAGFLF